MSTEENFDNSLSLKIQTGIELECGLHGQPTPKLSGIPSSGSSGFLAMVKLYFVPNAHMYRSPPIISRHFRPFGNVLTVPSTVTLSEPS